MYMLLCQYRQPSPETISVLSINDLPTSAHYDHCFENNKLFFDIEAVACYQL